MLRDRHQSLPPCGYTVEKSPARAAMKVAMDSGHAAKPANADTQKKLGELFDDNRPPRLYDHSDEHVQDLHQRIMAVMTGFEKEGNASGLALIRRAQFKKPSFLCDLELFRFRWKWRRGSSRKQSIRQCTDGSRSDMDSWNPGCRAPLLAHA